MAVLKERIEAAFGQIGRVSYHAPWKMLLLSALLMAFSVFELARIHVDTTMEGFLLPSDPALIRYNEFREQFGRDERVLISIESDAVFTLPFLRNLRALHEDIEETVPYVDVVDSLINVRHIYGEEDDLIVEDLMEIEPRSEADILKLKTTVASVALYENTYLSPDRRITNILVKPHVYYSELNTVTGESELKYLGDEQLMGLIAAIDKSVAAHPFDNALVRVAGAPAITNELNALMFRDMRVFVIAALAIIALALYALFRRASAVLMPMLVMITSLVSTMGLMSLFDQPLQMPTVILPSFILAVGVGDSIHLLTIYYRNCLLGKNRETALVEALEHTGLAMFFTSMTTAAGLCSFGQSDILPIANLGLFAAAGVMFAFLYTVFLLPALITLCTKESAGLGSQQSNPQHRIFDAIVDFSIRLSKHYPVQILLVSAVVIVASLVSASQLGFSHNPLVWLPDSSSVKQATAEMDKRMGGTIPIEVVIDTGLKDGLKDPVTLKRIDQVLNDMLEYQTPQISVGKTLSLVDMIKETNQALFSNDPKEYRIPDDRELIAQEFLLLEASGADDLFQLVDSQYQVARITLYIPWIDALYFAAFVDEVEGRFKQALGQTMYVESTGLIPLLARTLGAIMNATALSYFIAFVVISLMMMALLSSVKYGLLSMIPNLLPITLALGLMQYTGAPLDMFSMLIGSIAIGLSVDDTVHFMHGFRRELARHGDAAKAVADTLHTTGRAMLSTSIVLSCGFFVYLLSDMSNLTNFGLFTGLCIIVALLADFWLAPAMMILLHRAGKEKALP